MDPKDILDRAKKHFNSDERLAAEATWQSICKFVIPNQLINFSQAENQSPGARRGAGVYTSEAMIANRDLAAFIKDFSDPTERPTFRFVKEDLNNNGEAVRWLEKSTYLLHHHLTESNLDSESSKAYSMFPALGNMVLLQETKQTGNGFGGFIFKSIHLAEIAWAENIEGKVDTIFRKLKLTVKQAIEFFGLENLSDEIKKEASEMKLDKHHKFYHCVYPRVHTKVGEGKSNLVFNTEMPFTSVYIEDCGKPTVVKEEGYHEFPVFVTRWDTCPGEVTGRGPGHLAEPEIRTLNTFIELSLIALDSAVNDPILVSVQNAANTLDFSSNSVNFLNDVNGVRTLRSNGASNIGTLDYGRQKFTETIQKIFYLDKLYLPPRTETGEMSAYEVSRRMEQAHKVLGTTAGRLNHEFLSPMLIRSFSILLREGVLPPLPEVLVMEGIDIKVDFISQMVRSQKLRDGTTIQGWVNNMGAMANVLGPDILDNVDGDQAALILGRSLGVPEVTIRTDKEKETIRVARAKQAEQQRQLEAGIGLADINSKVKQ